MKDDLISRRKAFEYFVALWECIGTIMDRDEWEDVCMTTANEIPRVQPRKKGKWLAIGNTGLAVCECCCFITDKYYGYNFCPNCGADMKGEQDG